MATPGVAGALVTFLSNTAFTQFGWPSKWCALALSFLLGLLVFVGTDAAFWQKGLLYFLNSAIIFSVAVGANQAGAGLTGATKTTKLELPLAEYVEPQTTPSGSPYAGQTGSTGSTSYLATPGLETPPSGDGAQGTPSLSPPQSWGTPFPVEAREKHWFHDWFEASG